MPYLQFQSLSKSFPGVRALHDISFPVEESSVHALMGENGAGKSTLLKILSGVYRPDSGQLLLATQPQSFRSTNDAIAAGIAVIYQELQLVPEMSVAENLYLGHLPHSLGFLDKSTLRQNALQQLALLGEDIPPKTKLSSLPIGQRQMVEIAKALSRDAKVIAFDEPTSSLSSRETDKLFAVIRQLRSQGKVILYVSHRMDEIYSLCDAATVLRDGKHVITYPKPLPTSPPLHSPTSSLPPRDTLIQNMVGRSITDIFRYSPRPQGSVALEVRNLTGKGLSSPASFSVKKGEILGFFGLVGAGRTELLKLLYGAVRPRSGSIEIDSRPARISSPAAAIRSGIVLCPEDRKKEGIIPIRSVQENINLSGRRHFSPLHFFINPKRERTNAADQIRALSIKTPTPKQLIKNLSGGNQQKAILARWLSENNVKVILFDEPTRGIDVGAKSEIYSLIYRLAESGVAVIVVSSELPEVLGISDRICIMRQGSIAATLDRSQATSESVLSLALPATQEAA
ncbi:MAG TPA: L-arabinose ABC transporter ATP-binding protein AraG [Tepidisphaeraceae bacterium]|jgi:L-arabinose transport system ATP-binding protein|nr:L-arabinose ABC transporter ATP-binding protein AraG [Tepidisphaeraceae bacterium]